ncbi:hypothetical protein PCCS19_38070 [Paenibacillus sp. CCS19]|uniref:DUF6115 domain-containing protein n=1 Tax=Paenibacillus sp. CCS19 TaxID=3158387 RepID=UPI00256167CB|nr:hypothetical protein [Paenibacillus cellulosilyticus]GMK40751.1 hypothetical protein PCCS19_38070 [Paenibacillus cellulosilyticus]
MNMQPWGYVALLGAFIVVMSWTLPRRKAEQPAAQVTNNMEIALEQFMENMESDNRELVELVKRAQTDNAEQLAIRERRIIDLEHRCAELESRLEKVMVQPVLGQVQTAAPQAVDAAVVQPLADAQEVPVPRDTIRTRYPELFELYNEGKSIDAVARKLNMNKGEVQLIIQLAKQEEGVRA